MSEAAVFIDLWSWIARALPTIRARLGEGLRPPSAEASSHETALLRRLRGDRPGRQAAFRDLVEAQQAWLLHFLTCLLANPHDAQDVTQEVFVRAYLALDRFRGECTLRTWLTRIALNQAFNFKRKRRPEAETNVVALEDRRREPRLDEQEALVKALGRLAHNHREVLVLRYAADMDILEVAEHLDIGESAAKMRLKRARVEFANAYATMVGGPKR